MYVYIYKYVYVYIYIIFMHKLISIRLTGWKKSDDAIRQ